MGVYISRSSGKASTSGAASNTSISRNELHIDTLNAFNALNGDSRRSDVRRALDTLNDGETIYMFRDDRGSVSSISAITKNGEDSYTINGKSTDASGAVRLIYDGPVNMTFTSSAPDTSSHVKITGKKTETVDGLKFRSGIYDTMKNTSSPGKGNVARFRKFEEKGKITTYDGVQYGVHKSGGQWYTTHIPTGMLLGGGQDTMSGVVAQIRDVHERRVRGKDLSNDESRMRRMIRGDS